MKKKIVVGLDFDGVLAYNPFRVVRPMAYYVKSRFFGIKKLKFFYPTKRWQQILWIIAHESSILPAYGTSLFKEMVKDDLIEAHLITARYSFLDNHLNRWLRRHNLLKVFTSVNLNKEDEQPHLFKERVIKKYKLDYFVEDNLDIVKHLETKRKGGEIKTKILWIYNLFDRNITYPHKFPYLKKALEQIR